MGKFIDLTGQRFGRLVVVEKVEKPDTVLHRGAYYLCKCNCGNIKVFRIDILKEGKTVSCGCFHKEVAKKRGWKNRIDIVGQKFGKLLVTKYLKNSKYECLCGCGNICIAHSGNLKNGHTKSCGCLGENKFLPQGEASLNKIINEYKTGAKRRKLPFELTRENVQQLVTSNCSYCGCKPNIMINHPRGDLLHLGIDRIDSSKGYVEDNVVPCCGTCNVMKMAMSREEFLNHNERISNYQKEKYEKNSVSDIN